MMFGFVTNNQAQDYHFSQFYAVPLHLSPSFAGSYLGTRLISNYRVQWPEVKNAYNTFAVSVDHNFVDWKSGLGLLILRDVKGDLKISTNSFAIVYSYDIWITRNLHFRPGLNFSYNFSGIDGSAAVTRGTLNGAPTADIGITRDKVNYFDASLSGLVYTSSLWAGVTVNHLPRPNVAFGTKDKIPIGFSIYSGIKLGRKGRLVKAPKESLTIAFQYMQMDKFSQLSVGLMGYKEFLRIGVWHRGIPVAKENPGSDAFILSLGFEKGQFSAGLSHDFTISGLANYINGANEVYMTYLIPYSKPKKKYMPIPCPVF